MGKQNYKIGVSTVIAGIFCLLTLYAAFVTLQTRLLSSVLFVIAAVMIAPLLNEKVQKIMQEKLNFSLSTPLRWLVWFVLAFVATYLR